ncbi:SDR family NAD(P)-dependent oxidoreductase [Streptomyces sp. NPDC008222]|uniref:SDR family NAD(P)-dependent oxidoreductase n=1 Tax=Streptomyces sp. NPDC008222 TaxID=3364820 RepID=UPI0036EF3D3A
MTFLITGATRGIGASTARAAAGYGANVVVAGTREAAGELVAGEIRADCGEATFVACNVRDPDQVDALVAATVDAYGGIDVLHNNAGVNETAISPQVSLADMSVETFDQVLGVNLRGAWLCAKYALPHLRLSKRNPSIINTGSTGAFTAFPNCVAYGAAKGGLSLLTKNLALELAPSGIRVNSIAPGLTETEMVAGYMSAAEDSAAMMQAMTGTHLVPRLGRPEEIAELVCFLASDRTLFVNGVEWLIDGGALAWRGTR